jgi:signal transduction histidine kinase
LFVSFWYWIAAWIATSILSAVVYLLVEYPLRLQNAVRTATNDLRAAKETAEAANKAKTEFLATVSHELRTPLTAIRGALGLIDGKVLGDVPAKLSETISIAVNNSDHLSILIDDILDVTKIEAGTMDYKMKPLAVSSLIENAIAANRAVAERYGISIITKESMKSAWIDGDEHRLKQVFANLLSNAAKFSAPGSSVELSASRRDGKIRIAIIDYGCGIPDGFKAKIFERFSQVDSSDSRNVGGTGLGLSIVKDIIDHHPGATISFVSELGKGSTFAVEFPEHVAG